MGHKIDRIFELPEQVVEHILSFIPLKKILQLSILSKRWQNVWALLPIPKFDEYSSEFNPYLYCRKLGNISINEKEQIFRRKKDEFIYFMERILQSRYRQGLSVNMFKLNMFFKKSDCALVNRCIGYAIESNVKEFYLDVHLDVHPEFDGKADEDPKYYYRLPESVLTAKSITELKLDWCKTLGSFYSDINLPSLKKLSLSEIHVEDQFFQTLIAGCPVVEDISIEGCNELKSIHVSGLPKLMTLSLTFNEDLERIEVLISTLQSLHIGCLNNKLRHINLAPCENLNKLVLHGLTITDKWLHDILLKHPLLEILDLNSCNMLERVYISSHRMKTLNLSSCDKLVEVNIDTPNLHGFGYCGGLISFSFNAKALLEANLSFSRGTPWCVEKIAFLAKLSHPKLLTWTTTSTESMIIPKELREIESYPLCNVKKLELKASSLPEGFEFNKLLDALLWFSPLLEILFIELEDQNKSVRNIFFKFSYENPIYEGGNPNCCKRLLDPCWRHCLKTVKIEDSGGFADEKDLNKYFLENAKILKSFKYSAGSVSLKHG